MHTWGGARPAGRKAWALARHSSRRSPRAASPACASCAQQHPLLTPSTPAWPHAAACFAGDVPNLMGPEDLEQISSAMRPLMAAAGAPDGDKGAAYTFFVDRCALPAGQGVRARARLHSARAQLHAPVFAGCAVWLPDGSACAAAQDTPLCLPPPVPPSGCALTCISSCASHRLTRRSASACACSHRSSTVPPLTGSGGLVWGRRVGDKHPSFAWQAHQPSLPTHMRKSSFSPCPSPRPNQRVARGGPCGRRAQLPCGRRPWAGATGRYCRRRGRHAGRHCVGLRCDAPQCGGAQQAVLRGAAQVLLDV